MPDLKPASDEWQARWDAIMADPWLVGKLDRDRRVREHKAYLKDHKIDLAVEPGVVVDLGPGAGELLELAEDAGHMSLGVDAPSGVGGMGELYLEACRLMHQRQNLEVIQWRALDWIQQDHEDLAGKCVLVNSRGSLEQIFSDFLEGPPHHLHQDATRLRWRLSDGLLRSNLVRFLEGAMRLLRDPGGVLLVRSNGAEGSDAVDWLLQDLGSKVLTSVYHRPLVHCWTLPAPGNTPLPD